MPKVLIAWELGGGLGHVSPLRTIGVELVRRGSEVAIATTAGNVELCRQAFAGTGIEVLAAPTLPVSEKRLKYPCTYSDILHDAGYANAENVRLATDQWLELFDLHQPDLILADHSPTALLACCIRPLPKAAIGTGFLCPPDITPLPSLRNEIPNPHWATGVEQKVLDSINNALKAHGAKTLERVTELFSRANRVYPLTFPELDHYQDWREQSGYSCSYWQSIGRLPGQLVDWPARNEAANGEPKGFVYLRDHPAESPILKGLAYQQIPTICYSPRMSRNGKEGFTNSSVRISASPIDLGPILRDCEFAVLNGGHGTVCEFLRAGVPMLLLPVMLEQRLTGERIERLRAGISVSNQDLNEIATGLEKLLCEQRYLQSAKKFAVRHEDYSEEVAVRQLADDILGLAT